jgi:class 3 adenylate cyclase/tetratricopeptide (TPR) repeat protein
MLPSRRKRVERVEGPRQLQTTCDPRPCPSSGPAPAAPWSPWAVGGEVRALGAEEAGGAPVEEYRRDGEELLKQGAPLQAYDLLSEGLRRFPEDLRLKQLLALALARTGAGRLAREMLEGLLKAGASDEETVGLLARTYKDLWASGVDPADRRRFLALACERYLSAYREWGGYWSGINAATMALLLGDEREAGALALEVRDRCLRMRASEGATGEDYWVLATLGEAALLLRRWAEAEEWYRQAATAGGAGWGSLGSTRRNARLILEAMGVDASPVQAWLPLPRVVAFSGHLVDRPGRPTPRFPPSLEASVRQAMQDRLRDLDAGVGFASAGCGGDILFLEALEERKAEMQIVLPYDPAQFRVDSVDFVPRSDWGERYGRLLETASEVTVASDRRLGGGKISYEYGFAVLDGLACLRAEAIGTELVCLALWDGRPGDGPGGTASSVEWWRRSGRRLEILDLGELLRVHWASAWPASGPRTDALASGGVSPSAEEGDLSGPSTDSSTASGPGEGFDPSIVGLFFADVQGFSRLTEEELPRFVEHFLGAVADQIDALPRPPLLENTWGDGIHLVFADVGEAGRFAMDLSERVENTSWVAHGLPGDLTLRIALHAGPVYRTVDPVTRRPNYLGSNVTFAARIEPVTPPGEIYASWAFAALARSQGAHGFECGYVGRTPLAKGYGTIPMYVVKRRIL